MFQYYKPGPGQNRQLNFENEQQNNSDNVVYFDKCSGAEHSKGWLKYAFCVGQPHEDAPTGEHPSNLTILMS